MKFRSLLIAGVVAASLGGSLPAPASAQVPDLPAMGVQFHGTWSDYTSEQRIEVLDKMAAAGVKWIRVDLGWASFQETGPSAYSQWYVDRVDQIVTAARARGMQVLGTLWATPTWANGGASRATPPTNPDDYGRFAGWVANHFKGRVSAWEIWNEPNLDYFFNGTVDQYVGLMKVAYPAIKAADPSAQVVLGGPSANDTPWLTKVYAAGAKGYFDVMATHPYQAIADEAPELPDNGTKYRLSHVGAVHDLMVANGDGNKKIWFTEFGWSSHENWPGVENWNRGVTQEQQADFLIRALKYIGSTHPYVTNVFWYNERNLDTGKAQLDNYGLLNRDLSPKPAYVALKAFLGTSAVEVTPTPTTTATPTPTVSPDPTTSPAPTATATPSPTPTSTAYTGLELREPRCKSRPLAKRCRTLRL